MVVALVDLTEAWLVEPMDALLVVLMVDQSAVGKVVSMAATTVA